MSSRVVELWEWGDGQTVDLTSTEASTLRRVQASLQVTWLGPHQARIAPQGGTVGIVALSPDLTVVVRPRWPVRSLVELAAYALDLEVTPDLFREAAALAKDGPQDWLALFLALEIERLLAQGLRQGYREVDDDIPYVRGRIDFPRLALRGEIAGTLPCRFSDFILDTDENRILRGTLELLAGSPLTEPARRWVCRSLAAFRQVSLVFPSRETFDRIRLDRLNVHYRPALELCRMVVECLGLELSPGGVTGSSFFFPLATLFEKAVERALREAFPGEHRRQPIYSDRITVEGGPPHSVALRPDNVVGSWEEPWLVVDAKYKRPMTEYRDMERFLSDDLYQAFTYAVALGAPVVLVYPKVDEAVDAQLELTGYNVHVRTVDIGRQGVLALRELADELAGNYDAQVTGAPRRRRAGPGGGKRGG